MNVDPRACMKFPFASYARCAIALSGLLVACGGGGGGGGGAASASAPASVLTPVPAGPAPAVPAVPSQPAWLNGAVIYNVYTEIFSPEGNLAGVTAQLDRLQALGINVLWLMPLSSIAQGTNAGHPNYGSPYAIRDHTAINPRYGSATELTRLVQSAHAHGIKVILDMPLNHTSWDNPLLVLHPEFYLHSDGKAANAASIVQAFNYADVAQLNYKYAVNGVLQTGMQDYMTAMLQDWIRNFDVDGFRFDMPDNPSGEARMIPASFWQGLRPKLEAVKKDLLMLGESEVKSLATTPFELDYGWQLQSALRAAALKASALGLQAAWQSQMDGWPAGTLHMGIMQDWDLDSDLKLYGGIPTTLNAAVFNLTLNGVPLLWNGQEVGNDNGTVNTHAPINWNGPNAVLFSTLYRDLIALRKNNTALQQGSVTWLGTGNTGQVLAYERSDDKGEFLILINFSASEASGSLLNLPSGAASWTELTPAGAPGGKAHVAPPSYKLVAHDFAIFRRN